MKSFHRLGIITVIAFGLLVALTPQASRADQGDERGSVVQVSTPVYHPNFSQFQPSFGTYDYTVSWQGIPAAEASISVEQEGLFYRIIASAKTYSGIDLLYKLRYRAEGLISALDLSPVKTIIDQRENSTFKNTQITFQPNGEIISVRSKNGKDATVERLNTDNFTLDPFAAAFLARSLDWNIGDTKEFDTYNGKTRYIISLTAQDRKTLSVNGEKRDVWEIVPRVRMAGSTENHKKLRQAKIYVTADSRREVLQIVSSVFIGSVKTTLDSFTPSTRSPVTQVAQNAQRIIVK